MRDNKCPLCKKTSPPEDFYTSSVKHCKECWRSYHKRWKEVNRKQHLDISKKCWAKNKDNYNLDRKLGGRSLFEELLQNQNGVCAVCSNPEMSGRYKTLSVDHDHITGKIRGLLCSSCNRGIGLLKDNIEVLKSAISYLERTK